MTTADHRPFPESGPILLWHGTTDKFRDHIMRKGIQPRSLTGKSVYEGTLTSDAERVYLTDVYAPQFASIAVGQLGGRAMLIACVIDVSRLEPDTDFAPGGEHPYRAKSWRDCLEHTGCVSVRGTLSLDEIRNIYVVPAKVWRDFCEKGSGRIETGYRHRGFREKHADQLSWLAMLSRKYRRYMDGSWEVDR